MKLSNIKNHIAEHEILEIDKKIRRARMVGGGGGGGAETDPIWTADKPLYVPYAGATTDLDLGSEDIHANTAFLKNGYAIYNSTINNFYSDNLGADFIGGIGFDSLEKFILVGAANNAILDYSALTDDRTYILPNAAGTIALTSDIPAAYTDEQAQDAVGGMIGTSLQYVDATPLLDTIQDIRTSASPTFANLILTAGGDIKPSANSTTAINIAQADGTNFVTFDTTNKRVGIGTAAPEQSLQVAGGYLSVSDETKGILVGVTTPSANNYLIHCVRNTANNAFAQLYLEGNSAAGDYGGAADFMLYDRGAAANAKFFSIRNQAGIGSISSYKDDADWNIQGIIAWSNTTGYVGIGTTAAVDKFQVNSTAANRFVVTTTGAFHSGEPTGHNAANSIMNIAAAEPALNYGATINLEDTRALAAGIGSRILMGSRYTANGLTGGVAFGAYKETATSGEYGYSFTIGTRANGANITEKMRITGLGMVGINTTAPLRALDINEASGNCLRLIYNDSNGSAANYVDFLVSSSGDLTVTPSGGDILLSSDTTLLNFGAGTDMAISYNGTDGVINTSLVAASDLNITCGANKTLELQNVVYDDLQFQVSNAKVTPNNLLPSWEVFTTNTSEYAFAIDEEVDTQANELPHWWKQGTTGHAHIHITTKGVPAQEQKAQFTVTFAYADANEVWVEAPLTAEKTIPISTTALTNFYLDLGDLTLTNYLVGAQIRCRIKRVAKTAGGTEYAGDIFITQVGIHLEKDTMGSRSETTK